MDLLRLKALVDLVARSGIAELDLTEGEDRLRIVNGALAGTPPASLPTPATRQAVTVAAPAIAATEPDSDGGLIRAPMYGVFHRSQAPGAPPFIEVGQMVEPGQTLGLLEAMKVFSAVTAEAGGKVEAILVESGAEVSLGQPLLRLA